MNKRKWKDGEFSNEIIDNRKAEAFEYAGHFPAWQIAETFHLPVITIRQFEKEKNLYYTGR